MTLTRGETKSYVIDFTTCEIGTTDVSRAVLVVRQMGEEYDLRDGIVIDTERNTISYHFSQEETLNFRPGAVNLQLDIVTTEGERYVANKGTLKVVDTLIDEVI